MIGLRNFNNSGTPFCPPALLDASYTTIRQIKLRKDAIDASDVSILGFSWFPPQNVHALLWV